MSDSTSLIERIAALLFFLAVGAGVYAFMTHGDLKAMEQRLAAVEQERSTLKTELLATEKTVLANSDAVRTCTAELATFKKSAAAEDDAKSVKPKSPRAL